ncbi:cytidylyltransferase domain-containing protein [Roseivirga sp. E12]|uniref:acylneuraminate cytidylyltransferase family protein n=1 Tax=Roseivirga sp. E12 TaxID=2819237 RepID=UPI001ABCA572|nr:acylneuraminate cytidylyltransferase family protein [Roseivirga sp. E12]MBO3700888.1 acylneuraminate cytidylyltransferase family protein [Roseivirga sp. E12]
MNDILCIIPARGGSKGIKEKNLANVHGKPLIGYSIESAMELKNAGLVKRVIVSTDSKKIGKVSEELGAEVPFMRPKSLATDTSKSVDAILHAIEFYKEKEEYFKAILLLQPTSPLRSFEVMQSAITRFRIGGSESLISCYREEYINDLVMYRIGDDKRKLLLPLNSSHNKGVRRQDHGSILIRNGSLYITSVEYLERERLVISDYPAFVEMPKNESVNIDTLEDLKLLKSIIASRG